MNDQPLQGKTALVTGGSRGIGAAICRELARQGAKVIVHYGSSEAAARQVAEEIIAAGGQARLAQADMKREADVRGLFDTSEAAFGKIDILVNNAGVFVGGPVAELTEESINAVLDVNIKGVLYASAQAATRLNNGGRIINITSIVSRAAVKHMSVYCASKAAIDAITRCQARELGERGITVNAVAPGATDTDMLNSGLSEHARQRMIDHTALGRVGTPEDIARVVAFLASDAGGWVNGALIDANGGLVT